MERIYQLQMFPEYFVTDSLQVFRRDPDTKGYVPIEPSDEKLYTIHHVSGKEVRAVIAAIATLGVYGFCHQGKIESFVGKEARSAGFYIKTINKVGNSYIINDMEFKQHLNQLQYYINEYGVVYSSTTGSFVKPFYDKDGYKFLNIKGKDGAHSTRRVHTLTYETWSGIELPADMVIHHKDSCKINNQFSNLECVTTQQNLRYSVLNGERDLKTTYFESDIRKMCEMMQDGKDARQIAVEFGIGPDSKDFTAFRNRLSSIRNGYYWKDISTEYDFSNYGGKPKRIKHPTETIHAICRLIDGGASNTDIIRIVEHEGTDRNFFQVISGIRNKTKFQEISKNYEFNKDYQHDGSTRQTTRYGEAEIENVIQRKNNGESVKSIARDLGVGYTHLIQLVKRYEYQHGLNGESQA